MESYHGLARYPGMAVHKLGICMYLSLADSETDVTGVVQFLDVVGK